MEGAIAGFPEHNGAIIGLFDEASSGDALLVRLIQGENLSEGAF